jgi:hypothetical protein
LLHGSINGCILGCYHHWNSGIVGFGLDCLNFKLRKHLEMVKKKQRLRLFWGRRG